MNIYDFMIGQPFLSFLIAVLAALLVRSVVRNLLVYCINRPLRHRNIKLHGWPPKHCDADGDFKSEDG